MMKGPKKRISLHYLKGLLKDEQDASKVYKELSKKAMTKGEKQRLKAMAKDEARHAMYIKEMLERRDVVVR